MTAPTVTRRFRPTAAWLIYGLLVVEGLLWLSERYKWFWFNEHKGWTVLIGVAVVAVAMLAMLGWFIVALVFRWRFQFSIRSMLVLVVAVALLFSWITVEVQQAKRYRDAVTAIRQAEGFVYYDFQVDQAGVLIPPTNIPGPAWLRTLLGDDFFGSVVKVDVTCHGTDAILEKVEEFPQIRELYLGSYLSDRKITDAGLEHVGRMTRLQTLGIGGTRVTDRGVRKLQKALPNCDIERY